VGRRVVSTDVGTPKTTANPYVGPQSFRRDDPLYGRDHETADLLDLLIAERVVLLYSPSGAGKSSLIQAGLIPQLEAEGLEVLPVVGVTHILPPDTILAGPPRNRYVLSTVLSLEEGLPREHQRTTSELDQMTVAQYLAQWPDLDDRPGNEVLLFDQFEEILTADPTDHEAKLEFFGDVGTALRDRKLWALFSMREDFLAELDPYAGLVPTRFASRYRLDLLAVEQALEAMILPAADTGIDFAADAAQKLVDDLRRIRVQRPDGVTDELGPNVEPVQLQVACRQIWDRLEEDATRIDVKDVEAVGNVDQALAGYYADCVGTAAGATGVSERALRDWFEHELVTPQGIRAQVLHGPQQGDGFGERAVRILTDAHLVRAESRRGATWYELTHDRLIEPVQEDNARWREEHLSDFERRAAWWDEQSRPDQLLLVEADLTAAEVIEAASTAPQPQREHDFLEASRKARDQAERERRASKRTRRWLVVAVIGCIAALIAAGLAVTSLFETRRERSRAEDLATTAEVSALTGRAAGAVGWDVDLSLWLGQQAATMLGRSSQDLNADIRNALQLATDQTPVVRVLRGHGPARAAVYSADGSLIVTHHGDGSLVVWDATSGEKLYQLSGLEYGLSTVESIASIADGTRLGVVFAEGRMAIWPIARDGAGKPTLLERHEEPSSSSRVAFSPDGSRIASVGLNGLSVTDETGQLVPGFDVAESADRVGNELEWTADGEQLVVAEANGVVSQWDARTGEFLGENYRHSTGAFALDVSPSGSMVASATDESAVITDLATGEVIHSLRRPGIVDVSFSSDGSRLVVTCRFGGVAVIDPSKEGVGRWVTANGMLLVAADVDPTHVGRAVVASEAGDPAVWDVTAGHPRFESSVESGPDGTVVTASYDGSVNTWSPDLYLSSLIPASQDPVVDASLSRDGDLVAVARTSGAVEVWSTRSAQKVLSQSLVNAEASAVALSPDGRFVAAGGSDGLVTVWNATTDKQIDTLRGHSDAVVSVEYGKDAGQLVSASSDGTAIVWDLDLSEPEHVLHAGTKPTAVAWNTQGTLVAIAGMDSSVQFWDPQSGKRLNENRRNEHARVVNDIAFNSTGDRLVSGGDDHAVIVWDATAGTILHRIQQSTVPWRVAFSPDAERVLVANGSGVPHVVFLNGDELLTVAKEQTTREISAAECRLYLDDHPDCPED
jgi:WD40 repeat protein